MLGRSHRVHSDSKKRWQQQAQHRVEWIDLSALLGCLHLQGLFSNPHQQKR
jgi:hypothetical protein